MRLAVASAFRVSYVLAVTQVVFIIALFYFDLVSNFFPGPLDEKVRRDVALALVVMSIYSAIVGSVMGVAVRIYPSFGSYARGQWWGIAVRLGFFACVLLTSLAGGKMAAAWIAIAIAGLVIHLLVAVDIQRHFGRYISWWRGGSFRFGFGLFNRSLVLGAVGILEGLIASGTLVFLGSIVHAAGLALFVTMRTMTGLLGQASMTLIAPIMPDLVRLVVQKEGEKFRDVMATMRLLLLTGSGVCVLLMAAIAKPVFDLWTRGVLSFDPMAFAFLSWAAFVRLAGLPESVALRALNKNGVLLLITIVQMAVLLLGLSLVRSFPHLWCAAACLATADLLSGLFLPRFFLSKELRVQGINISYGTLDYLVVFGVGTALVIGATSWGTWLMLGPCLVGIALFSREAWRNLSSMAQERLLSLVMQIRDRLISMGSSQTSRR